MRPKELVPILAKEFGVAAETAYVIDRDLFEHGFRAKGKGRAWPDMTRREAIHFLLGCAVVLMAPKAAATRASEGVAMWTAARTKLDVCGQIVSEEDLDSLYVRDEAERKQVLDLKYDRAQRLSFLHGKHGRTVTLVDYLLMVMHHFKMQACWDDLVLTLSPSHFMAAIKIDIGNREWDVEYFRVPKRPRISPDKGFRVDVSIPDQFLSVITDYTADPLDEGGSDQFLSVSLADYLADKGGAV